jgi:hypothetical protein
MEHCEICGKERVKGDAYIPVERVGCYFPFGFFAVFNWNITFIHLDCLLKQNETKH